MDISGQFILCVHLLPVTAFLIPHNFQMLYDQYVLVACRVNPVAAVTRIGRLYLSDVKYTFQRYVT